MNTKNNKRRRESQKKIEEAFIRMLQREHLNKISVTDICKETGLNRTTFYANYTDIYDLADKIRQEIEDTFNKALMKKEDRNAITFFRLIYENQIMFQTYFKLDYDKEHIGTYLNSDKIKEGFQGDLLPYHIAFFQNGLNAIIKMWLESGCRETPEEMADFIKREYRRTIR